MLLPARKFELRTKHCPPDYEASQVGFCVPHMRSLGDILKNASTKPGSAKKPRCSCRDQSSGAKCRLEIVAGPDWIASSAGPGRQPAASRDA